MDVFIDTSLSGCSLALFNQQGIVDSLYDPIERGIAEVIIPHYQSLLQKNNTTPSDIENIYVTVGPGSFTGLRVGLTVAKFIGFSLQKPVHGLSSFQALSIGIDRPCQRMVIIETKRDDYYCQMVDQYHKPIGQGENISARAIQERLKSVKGDFVVTGDAVMRFSDEIGDHDFEIINQSSVNIEKICVAIQTNKIMFEKPEAFYIRDADTSTPKVSTL